jgi:hypothetical protein
VAGTVIGGRRLGGTIAHASRTRGVVSVMNAERERSKRELRLSFQRAFKRSTRAAGLNE